MPAMAPFYCLVCSEASAAQITRDVQNELQRRQLEEDVAPLGQEHLAPVTSHAEGGSVGHRSCPPSFQPWFGETTPTFWLGCLRRVLDCFNSFRGTVAVEHASSTGLCFGAIASPRFLVQAGWDRPLTSEGSGPFYVHHDLCAFLCIDCPQRGNLNMNLLFYAGTHGILERNLRWQRGAC